MCVDSWKLCLFLEPNGIISHSTVCLELSNIAKISQIIIPKTQIH